MAHDKLIVGIPFVIILQSMLKDKPYGPAPLLPSNIFILVLVASCTVLLFYYNGEYKRLHCEKRSPTNRYSKLSSDVPGSGGAGRVDGQSGGSKLADPLLVRISSNSNTDSNQNSRRDEASFVGHYRYTTNTPLKEEEEEEEEGSVAQTQAQAETQK